MNEPLLALVGFPGWIEVSVIFLLGFLLFGRRLPGIARSIGQSLIEFKRGLRPDEEANDAPGLASQDER